LAETWELLGGYLCAHGDPRRRIQLIEMGGQSAASEGARVRIARHAQVARWNLAYEEFAAALAARDFAAASSALVGLEAAHEAHDPPEIVDTLVQCRQAVQNLRVFRDSTPIKSAPPQWTLNGCDTRIYGRAAMDRETGGIDVLINNAGICGPVGPMWEVDATEWRKTFDINVEGSFLASRIVLPGMIGRESISGSGPPRSFHPPCHGADPEQAARLVLALASGRANRLSGRHVTVRDSIDMLRANIDRIEREDLQTLRLRTTRLACESETSWREQRGADCAECQA
jgi:hypothetical protein